MGSQNSPIKGAGLYAVLPWCFSFAFRASRTHSVFRIASQLISPILTILISFFGRQIINLLAAGPAEDSALGIFYYTVGALLLTECVLSVLDRTGHYIRGIHNERIEKLISDVLMHKALVCDLAQFDNPKYYDAMMLAERNAYVVSEMVWNAIRILGSSYTCILTFIIVCRAKWEYGIIMALSVFPATIVSAVYTRRVYELQTSQANDARRAAYHRQVSFDRSYAHQIRIFSLAGILREKYSRMWQQLYEERRKLSGKYTAFASITECLPEIASIIIGVSISMAVFRGEATVGDYSFYIGLLAQLGLAIQTLIGTMVSFYDNRMRIEKIITLEKIRNEIRDEGTEILSSVQSIEFDRVTFRYPGNEVATLRSFSLCIYAPSRVCLSGRNGSGKTTVLKLLLRLYDPDDGVIYINGKDIRLYTLDSLRKAFSVYYQQMGCFHVSIRDNFVMTDAGHKNTDDDIRKIMTDIGCDDIMCLARNDLSTGVSRMFDPQGIELSVGQYQKLSVARALYRSHSVLVLDEPSSALDRTAEDRIFAAVKESSNDGIVICVSHQTERLKDYRIIQIDN